MLVSEIINESMHSLAAVYVKEYQRDGKNFINCFIKYKSIRMACGFIRASLKGEKLEGDFFDYCKRFNLHPRDQDLLNDTLRMIYTITKTEKQ